MSEQQQKKVAMVIIAHPDDAEFGAAGTVATWVEEGWDAYYVVCTDGGSGGPDEATDVGQEARLKVTEARMREQREAGKALGLKDVIFLGYPDGRLEPTLELRRDLVRVLRQYRPTRLICQSPDRVWTPAFMIRRFHPDHLASGRAALAAVYPASQNPWDFPELLQEGLQPHKVTEIYVMGPPEVNYFVDISSTIEKKIAALLAHQSQFTDRYEEIAQLVRDRSAEMGKKHGVAYAEEFHRLENT